MDAEIVLIEKNKNCYLINLKKGKDIIRVEWVYKIKFNEGGII